MPISKAEGIMCVDIMAPSTSVLGLPSYSLIQHLLLSAVMIKASVYPKWDVLHFWSLDKASFVFSTYIFWGCLLHRAGDTCAERRMAFIRERNVPKKVRFRGLMIQNLSMLKGMKKKSVLILKARVKILKKCIKQVYRRNNSTLEMQPYGSITKPICEGYWYCFVINRKYGFS